MSLLSWLLGGDKPGAGHGTEMPVTLNRDSSTQADMSDSAASAHRKVRRAQVYAVVRDAMLRAGVLSVSYKFKVLSLNTQGTQFMVMIDLAREYGGETVRLAEIEALMVQAAKARHDLEVTAVYWRNNDRLNGTDTFKPAQQVQSPIAATPLVRTAAQTHGVTLAASAATAVSQPNNEGGLRGQSLPVARKARRDTPAEEFVDTESTGREAFAQSLSSSQYGDLM